MRLTHPVQTLLTQRARGPKWATRATFNLSIPSKSRLRRWRQTELQCKTNFAWNKHKNWVSRTSSMKKEATHRSPVKVKRPKPSVGSKLTRLFTWHRSVELASRKVQIEAKLVDLEPGWINLPFLKSCLIQTLVAIAILASILDQINRCSYVN